ncbi:MAG: hypothetical protein COB41_06390 [Proteobacteria bacterium]|nr:MAG: hypothetical protein COB41_06390 [Pseudomonadota bacterium]
MAQKRTFLLCVDTKYSSSEPRKHRDLWYDAVQRLSFLENEWQKEPNTKVPEVYEGQTITLKGFVWRDVFPDPPNYESFETDKVETLVLPESVCLFTNSFEIEDTIRTEKLKKLQLCVDSEFYNANRNINLTSLKCLKNGMLQKDK